MTFRTLKKWLSGAVTTFLFIVLILMVFVVVLSKASGGEPAIFGYEFKTVLSGSMEPTFQTGSIIAVKPVNNAFKLQKGDVITYKKDKTTTVTHRIYKVKGNGKQTKYITKGDNNDSHDLKPVLPKNVEAVYTGFTVPYVGYFIHFAQSKEGTTLLMILPGILLLINSVIIIWKAFRKIDGKKEKEVSSTDA